MTLEEARKIVQDASYWNYFPGDATICLDGDFTAEELQAFLVYMQEEREKHIKSERS